MRTFLPCLIKWGVRKHHRFIPARVTDAFPFLLYLWPDIYGSFRSFLSIYVSWRRGRILFSFSPSTLHSVVRWRLLASPQSVVGKWAECRMSNFAYSFQIVFINNTTDVRGSWERSANTRCQSQTFFKTSFLAFSLNVLLKIKISRNCNKKKYSI